MKSGKHGGTHQEGGSDGDADDAPGKKPPAHHKTHGQVLDLLLGGGADAVPKPLPPLPRAQDLPPKPVTRVAFVEPPRQISPKRR